MLMLINVNDLLLIAIYIPLTKSYFLIIYVIIVKNNLYRNYFIPIYNLIYSAVAQEDHGTVHY